MKTTPLTPYRLRRRIFGQLWMLALQFILGMLLNLIGPDTSGTTHTAYIIILAAHIFNAIGLLEGCIFIAIKAPRRLTWAAATAICLTFLSGVLTVRTQQDIWSFMMAIGFIISSWLYVILYLQADRQASRVQREPDQ